MDIWNSLRHGADSPVMKEAHYADTALMPQTITEMLDRQIKFYEGKIADLKEAKEAISPEVERALNALAKL